MSFLNKYSPDADDIASENEHFKLVKRSLSVYTELQFKSHPSVLSLNQRCASLKYLIDNDVWPGFDQLLRSSLSPVQNLIYFPHRVGDGLHYITNNPIRFQNGVAQSGDTSEGCILFNLELILTHYNIPNMLNDLWNMAYPDDPMNDDTVGYLLYTHQDFTETADLRSPENLADALRDLQAIQCQKLAAITIDLLRQTGLRLSFFLS